MPKINQEEYEVLKELDDKWKWISRDRDRLLLVFNTKPRKGINYDVWDILGWDEDEYKEVKDNTLFQFIQWEDSEPYNIAELIEEYENQEKEVKKDKQWLKEAILALKNKGNPENNQTEKERELGRAQQWAWNNCVDRAYELAKQLDEPEVLSTDWIKNNQRTWASTHGLEYHVPANKLYGKLVPKQEEVTQEQVQKYLSEHGIEVMELPVIPQFVADYIQEGKDLGCDLGTAMTVQTELLKGIRDYIKNNEETFARAWLDGYEGEEEKKYVIKISEHDYMVMDDEGFMYPTDINVHNYKSEFTEREIKDYDSRFWPFAVKVEELEE